MFILGLSSCLRSCKELLDPQYVVCRAVTTSSTWTTPSTLKGTARRVRTTNSICNPTAGTTTNTCRGTAHRQGGTKFVLRVEAPLFRLYSALIVVDTISSSRLSLVLSTLGCLVSLVFNTCRRSNGFYWSVSMPSESCIQGSWLTWPPLKNPSHLGIRMRL